MDLKGKNIDKYIKSEYNNYPKELYNNITKFALQLIA